MGSLFVDGKSRTTSAAAAVTLFAVVTVFASGGASCGSGDQADGEHASAGSGVITGAGGATSASSSSASTGTGGAGGDTTKTGPPYPIVLAHGFFGFNDFAGLDFETYYFNVKAHLHEQLNEDVETPAVDPFNDSDFRGAQLLVRVEELLAKTGAAKVNIVGHSQGGLDARVVANARPDLVASVITVATPHYGSPVGDVAMKLIADPNAKGIVDQLAKILGGPIFDQVGNETSLAKPLYLFSQPGITAFNAAHPDEPGVFYASLSGRSAFHFMDADCEADVAVSFITPWEAATDPLDALFVPFAGVLKGGIGKNYAHDGLVRVRDARWGEFWGCLAADHVDEVGQILGDNPGTAWSHLDFYVELVTYLRARGL